MGRELHNKRELKSKRGKLKRKIRRAEIVSFSELSQKAPKQMDIFDFLS